MGTKLCLRRPILPFTDLEPQNSAFGVQSCRLLIWINFSANRNRFVSDSADSEVSAEWHAVRKQALLHRNNGSGQGEVGSILSLPPSLPLHFSFEKHFQNTSEKK